MKRRWPFVVLCTGAAIFAFGLVRLLELRFDRGDVYPAYSSLRADPLGTMALYESLERMPGISVRRDFMAANRLPEEPQTTYLHLAASTYSWEELPEDVARELQHFLVRGGRLVIAFEPQTTRRRNFFRDADEQETSGKKSGPDKSTTSKGSRKKRKLDPDEAPVPTVSFKERWGVEFGFIPLPEGESDAYAPVQVSNRAGLPLPERMLWHSGMVFTNLNKSWQTIYSRGSRGVVIERKVGPGSLVLASDSYFLSNEALLKDRHADFLAWLVGPARTIVFDEAHFGVVETEGVAGLMRKYRLHGLLAGLVFIAGLFIWKNSASLAPPQAAESQRTKEGIIVAGRDSAAGFVNLLRRNIKPADVLNVCFAEWARSRGRETEFDKVRATEAQAIVEAENGKPRLKRDPTEAYRIICETLHAHHGATHPGPQPASPASPVARPERAGHESEKNYEH